MSELTMEEKTTCSYCSSPLIDEELKNPHTEPNNTDCILCDMCFDDHFRTECACCEEYFEEAQKPEDEKFVISKQVADETGLKMGVYSVLSYPYYYGSIVSGFDNFFDHAIRLDRKVDVQKLINYRYGHKCEPVSGSICLDCYQKLTLPLNRVNHNEYINMGNREKLHKTISVRGIMNEYQEVKG